MANKINCRNYLHSIVRFSEITVDIVDSFVAHDREQSASPVADSLQIVTRSGHSTDAGRSAR
jgi:hypothetical protein